jgi:hypothetical protein
MCATGATLDTAAVLADSVQTDKQPNLFGILLSYSLAHSGSFLPIR